MSSGAITTPRNNRPRLAEIDGLRAVACLMVLLYHTAQFAGEPAITRWTEPMNAGVDIFIVLSGFCLFLPVVANPAQFTTRRFLRQRARRIIPAYYASMIYVVALPCVLVVFWRLLGREASWQPLPDATQWLTHLTFTHMFSARTWAGINGSYWSLGLEAQFYIAMPIVVLLYRRFGVRGLIGPAAVSLAWNIGTTIVFWGDTGFSPARFVWEANLFGRWLEFTAGAFAAYLVHQTRRQAVTLDATGRAMMAFAGLTVIVGDLHLVRGTSLAVVEFLILPAGVTLLLVGISAAPEAVPGPVTRALRVRPVRFLGTVSYSFYLLHQPTEWYFSQLLKGAGVDGFVLWIAQLTVGASLVLGLAMISHRLFEKPRAGSSRDRSPSHSAGPRAMTY